MFPNKISKPFGLWSSPLSANKLSQGIRIDEAAWDSDGRTLVWLEGRSGKGVLVASKDYEPGKDLNEETPCRGGVGYGGGEFVVKNGIVFFAGKDGCLYRRPLGYGAPKPITPPFGAIASPVVSPDGRWVSYVHTDEKNDALGVIDSMGKLWPIKLASGADFYMQPIWSPDGKHLAWVEWDNPNMPWDETRLILADISIDKNPEITSSELIAGGHQTIIFQPEFSPDGRYLSYLTNNEDWDALVLYDLKLKVKKMLLDPKGVHIMEPAWVQGMRNYFWSPDGQSIIYIQNKTGFASLWRVSIANGAIEQIPTEPYTWLEQISISSRGDISIIASSAQIPPRVIIFEKNSWRVIARSTAEDIAPEYLASPQAISWLSKDGVEVHGLYYPPTNPEFSANGKPPVIVYIHGGPTSQVKAGYAADTSYFTTRGYGWLNVNYRGSTGYGHNYKNQLRQRWGDVDVEDAVGGARALVSQGLANEKQLIILGGSAGGYTVLNSLIRYPGVFKAGVCLYGVSNLFTIDQDSNKFELFYNSSLVGTLPEAAERFHAWSPVFHAEKIKDALAIFQGEDDGVVPPSQSEEIVSKLRQYGIPHIYKLYPGEGHGFRKSETLLDYFEQTENFLQQYVLFAP